MKAAFFTGMKFSKCDGKFYHVTFKNKLIQERYLSVFESILIFASEERDNSVVPTDGECSSGDNIVINPSNYYFNGADAFNPLIVKKCKREIEDVLSKVDCAIIRLPSNIGIWACEICERKNFPYLVEVVGNVYDSMMTYAKYTRVLANSKQKEMKLAIEKAKYAIYVSKEYLQNIYPMSGVSTNCSNVCLGVVEDSILHNRQRKIKTKKTVEKKLPIKLCTCGGIDLKYKGHKYVFEAMRLLKEKDGIICKYYIAGSGSKKMLQKEAEKRNLEEQVIFTGQLKHEEVYDLIDNCDIYIQPSLTEGLPRALIEGMSRACPCIGSNVGGIPELLYPDLLFTPRDSKEIASKIKYAMENELVISNRLFEESKEYESIKIEQRRQIILNKFKESVNNAK